VAYGLRGACFSACRGKWPLTASEAACEEIAVIAETREAEARHALTAFTLAFRPAWIPPPVYWLLAAA
jgi:hypothetical protein